MEVRQGWSFTDEQRAGIAQGLNNGVCVITGGARCWKDFSFIGNVVGFRML